MFGRKQASSKIIEEESSVVKKVVFGCGDEDLHDEDLFVEFPSFAPEYSFDVVAFDAVAKQLASATVAALIFPPVSALDAILDAVVAERKKRLDGTPVLVLALRADGLTAVGEWLMQRAKAETLEGVRLVLALNASDALAEISEKLMPVDGSNVISMPISPEVEDSPKMHFFAFSPQIRGTVKMLGELAENNIERVYLLGGPGAGKTSLAYYYWLKRARGRFIAVNLNAESTGDKEAMKSLLCGHVTGAFPGASSREGAFSYADGGVTFLDESHGVTGVVMQVLMEALDSGQYLPFGATKKRLLECAVIFASNRSWEQLRSEINLDEHARLGATIVPVHDLVIRREDMIASIAVALAKFKAKCRTWAPPAGLTEEAWHMLRNCSWRGNVRTLFRTMDTALVAHSLRAEGGALLDGWDVQEGLTLWEPEDHHSHKLYTSYR